MDIFCEIDRVYMDYMVTEGNHTLHMSHIQIASLSYALLLQANQGTAQLQLQPESI